MGLERTPLAINKKYHLLTTPIPAGPTTTQKNNPAHCLKLLLSLFVGSFVCCGGRLHSFATPLEKPAKLIWNLQQTPFTCTFSFSSHAWTGHTTLYPFGMVLVQYNPGGKNQIRQRRALKCHSGLGGPDNGFLNGFDMCLTG